MCIFGIIADLLHVLHAFFADLSAPVKIQHNIEDPIVISVRNHQENKIESKSISEQSNKNVLNNEQSPEKPIPKPLTQFKNSVTDAIKSDSLEHNFCLVNNVDSSKNKTKKDETIENVKKERPSLSLKTQKQICNKLPEVNIEAERNLANDLKSEMLEDNIYLVNNVDTTNSRQTMEDETNENVNKKRQSLDLKAPEQTTNELPEVNIDEICSVPPEIKEEGFCKYTCDDIISIDSDEDELPYSQIFDLGQHDQRNQSDVWYEEYRKERDGSEEEAESSSESSEVNSIDEGWFQRLSQCNATDLESGINEDIICSKPTSLIDDEFDVSSKFEDPKSRSKALDFIAVETESSSTKSNYVDEITIKSKNKPSVSKLESKVREKKTVKNQQKRRRSNSKRIIDSSEKDEIVNIIFDSDTELTARSDDKSYKQEKRKHSSSKNDFGSLLVSPSKNKNCPDREKYIKVHPISNMTNENENSNSFGKLIREKFNEDQVKNNSKDITNLETLSIHGKEVKRKISVDTDESTSSSSSSSKHKKKYKIHSAQQENSELNLNTSKTINKTQTMPGKKFKASENSCVSPHSDTRNNLNPVLSKDLIYVAREQLLDIIIAEINENGSPDSSDLPADEAVLKFDQSNTVAKSINQHLVDFEDQIIQNTIVRIRPDHTLSTECNETAKEISTNKEKLKNSKVVHKLDDNTKLTAVNKKILDSHKKTPVPIIQALSLPSRKRQASMDTETKSIQESTKKKLCTDKWISKKQSNKSDKQLLSKSEIKAIRSAKLKGLINKPKHSLEETKPEDKTKQITTAKITTKITDRNRSEIFFDTLVKEKPLKENETLKKKSNHDSKTTNLTKESKSSLSSFKIPRRPSNENSATTNPLSSNTSTISATSKYTNNVLKPCNSSAKPTEVLTIPLIVTNEPTNVPVSPLEEDCLSLVDTKLTHQISNTALNKLKTRVAHVPPPISDVYEKEPIVVKLLPDQPNSKSLQDLNLKFPKKSNLKRLVLQNAKEKRKVKFNHCGDDPLTVYVQVRNFEPDYVGTLKKVTKSEKKERIQTVEKPILKIPPHVDYSLETLHQICKWNCNWFEVSNKYLFSFNHNKTCLRKPREGAERVEGITVIWPTFKAN